MLISSAPFRSSLALLLAFPLVACATSGSTDLEVEDPVAEREVPLPSGLSAAQQALAKVSNAARRDNTRPLFQIDARLSRLAQRHAEDMVKRGYFSHKTPEGQDPFQRLQIAGIRFRAAAENIGQNTNPGTAVAGWLQSPPHRKNLLSKLYGKLGVGAAPGPDGNTTYVQIFTD